MALELSCLSVSGGAYGALQNAKRPQLAYIPKPKPKFPRWSALSCEL